MSKEKQIEEMAKDIHKADIAFLAKCIEDVENALNEDFVDKIITRQEFIAKYLYNADYRKQSEWISVDERLPTEDEYLTHHNDGLDTLKRITVAYMTDTIEYTIGCYDGYKWVNQLGNKKINDVVAWKPFELYEAPKGGEE